MAEYGPGVPADIGERIQQIIDRLDIFHRKLRETEKRIEGVERLAEDANLPRVRFAAKDAFTRITDAGAKLVETHLQLGHILNPPREEGRRHE